MPMPPDPGPGEVLVRLRAIGICGSDMHWYKEGGIGDLASRVSAWCWATSPRARLSLWARTWKSVRIGQRVAGGTRHHLRPLRVLPRRAAQQLHQLHIHGVAADAGICFANMPSCP